MKNLFVLSLTALLLALPAVRAQDEPVKERKLGLAKPIVLDSEKEVYGAAFKNTKPVVSLAELAKNPKAWDGKDLQVRGRITGVCAKKGCWMMVKEGDQDIRVTFTGYKFFVPLDVAGREVGAEGKVQVKVESEAQRRHYAEDAGKSPEEIAKIVGDKVILSFVADSVQIGKLPEPPKKCDGCEEEEAKKASECCSGSCCGGSKQD